MEGQAEVKAEEGQPPAATAPAAAEEEKKAVSGLLADMTDAAQAGDTEMAEVEQPEAGAGAAAAAAGGTQEQNPVQANVSQQDGELHCLSAHRCCHASLLAVMCTRVSPLPRPSCSAALLPRLMPSNRVPCRPCAALCVCGHLPLGPSRAARVARGAARRLPPVAAGCRRGAGGGGAPDLAEESEQYLWAGGRLPLAASGEPWNASVRGCGEQTLGCVLQCRSLVAFSYIHLAAQPALSGWPPVPPRPPPHPSPCRHAG